MKWAAAVLMPAALALMTSTAEDPRRRESPDALAAAAASFMEEARVTGDAGMYARAEAACDRALVLAPDHYDAMKLRAWVYGGEHRFGEAAAAARRALAVRPSDPFNYGTLGDALVETGDYEGAESAFQHMLDLRPDSASYARAAYLRELYGDVDGAIDLMTRAMTAADPHDARKAAWYRSQIGDLYFSRGDFHRATAWHQAALAAAPRAHAALAGLARAHAALGFDREAVDAYEESLAIFPSPVVAAELGNLLDDLGRHDEARRQLDLVEATLKLSGPGFFDRQIAMIHAERGAGLDDALAVAEKSLSSRKDIYGWDAVAWCALKAGHVARAREAIAQAMRLNTRDAKLYYHAGMIALASHDDAGARRLLGEALRINPCFDRRGAAEARRVLGRLS